MRGSNIRIGECQKNHRHIRHTRLRRGLTVAVVVSMVGIPYRCILGMLLLRRWPPSVISVAATTTAAAGVL